MTTKARELDNRKQGVPNACPICRPHPKRITEDRLWQWAMTQPGPVKPLR